MKLIKLLLAVLAWCFTVPHEDLRVAPIQQTTTRVKEVKVNVLHIMPKTNHTTNVSLLKRRVSRAHDYRQWVQNCEEVASYQHILRA